MLSAYLGTEDEWKRAATCIMTCTDQNNIHCGTELPVLFPSARTVSPYSIRPHPPVRSGTELIIKSCYKQRVSETRLEAQYPHHVSGCDVARITASSLQSCLMPLLLCLNQRRVPFIVFVGFGGRGAASPCSGSSVCRDCGFCSAAAFLTR